MADLKNCQPGILSKRMKTPRNAIRAFVLTFFLGFFFVQFCFGWGKAGHKMVNRVAVEMLPSGMPGFLRTGGGVERD